jgi:hypothetical protein
MSNAAAVKSLTRPSKKTKNHGRRLSQKTGGCRRIEPFVSGLAEFTVIKARKNVNCFYFFTKVGE